MKPILIASATALALTLQGCDQPQQQSAAPPAAESGAAAPSAMGNMPMPSEAPATGAQTYSTTGEITAVTADSVTINHQPVPALGWPAMTMTFRAPNTTMTTGLPAGAPVEFSFRQEGGDNVLTEIKRR